MLVVYSHKPRTVFVCGGLVVAFGRMYYKSDKCISATPSVETTSSACSWALHTYIIAVVFGIANWVGGVPSFRYTGETDRVYIIEW